METLNWHNTMRDYYWELTHRNIMLGMRIGLYGYNDGLARRENTFAATHRKYLLMLYDRLSLR